MMRIAPGTVVFNDDPEKPLSGEILTVGPTHAMTENEAVVRWDDGSQKVEELHRVILSAKVVWQDS